MLKEHVETTDASVRPACAADAEFLAWAILTASRGHLPKGWFDIALNRPEGACLEFLRCLTTTATRSRWHYSQFLVADVRGCPVAALGAFRASDAYPVSPAAINETAEALGIPVAEQDLLWERGAFQFTCTTHVPDDCWILENIATLPSWRRRGYTGDLLAAAIHQARARGLREAMITFYIGNDPAQRLYERAGFHFLDERRHAEFAAAIGAPGLRRVTREL
jgi:translation initiation factor 4G